MKQIKKKLFLFLIFIITNISAAQANVTTYNVEGIFTEPSAYDTIFSGTFDWDGSTLSNLQGAMNSSMFYKEDELNLTLSNNLITDMNGSVVTASIFLNPSSVVFATGGYDATEEYMLSETFGMAGIAPTPNPSNAYFTFSFDTVNDILTPIGVSSTMQYGDCTPEGMMGSLCMTAFGDVLPGSSRGAGTMSGYASSLSISAVPVPAAVWLFASALLGLVGVSRKRTLSV